MVLSNNLSTEKSTSGLKVALHPLVILTISDYITRHTLRNQPGPLIGALLGQQNGSQVSIEHAFEVNALTGEIDVDWFVRRLEDMKAVHKSPPLEFIGFYTIVPTSGPTSYHSSLESQFRTLVPEAVGDVLLLGFHPQAALTHSTSGSLPVSIYESCQDASHRGTLVGGQDVEMSDDSQDPFWQGPTTHFHTLGYTIESGEAERIAVDFVARGNGNATAVTSAEAQPKPSQGGEPMISTKKRTAEKETKASPLSQIGTKEEFDINSLLSPDEAEMIASLTAKANAVRMLQSRISLMSAYITDFEGPQSDPSTRNAEILRAISALLSRLPLVVPSSTDVNGFTTTEGFDKERLAEKSDVELVTLLSKMTESVTDTRELGKRFAILNAQKKNGKVEDEGVFQVGGLLGQFEGLRGGAGGSSGGGGSYGRR